MRGQRIRVRGRVQGVGFRPFVWQLARRMGLQGRVLNDPEGVLIEVWGAGLDAFAAALSAEAPALARVEAVEVAALDGPAPAGFEIAASEGRGAETGVTPDAATCAACAAEIRDPGERRHGYGFANCTHCGPRFSILRGLPYDRARTAMADFPMCPACAAEYADPGDRRFHAQPVACPDCGPRLWLEAGGVVVPGDALAAAAARLAAGAVLAIKGIGGFHLCCDARDAAAVELLRARKRRPEKPLALMAPLALVRMLAAPGPAEEALLADPAAPIVLLSRRAGDGLPEALAPGQDHLGWMLPYTPLHHLLLDAVGGPLVMTSGNLSGEPQVIGNDEARTKLAAFADALLLHDREIVRRLDDGVARVVAGAPMLLRRGRGQAPGTLPLPPGLEAAPPVAAFGGQMKGAICLTGRGAALLSHHLGDLDDALSWDEFGRACTDYAALFEHAPAALACDLHQGYRATGHAEAMAGERPLIRVQHHHAHLAACLAENGWPRDGGPVAGIVLDGLGLGPDGTVWGGEMLVGDYDAARRAAWLRPAPLPGGDAANREPWRNLLARLDQAGLAAAADALWPDRPLAVLRRAVAAGVNAPLSSSAGRLFDAVAAAVGIADGAQSFEGAAAMRLEALARQAGPAAGAYDLPLAGGVLDPAPMLAAILADRAAGVAPPVIAARFHEALARGFAAAARACIGRGEAVAVALSGGCFQNALLTERTLAALDGLRVLRHREVPANDGGLALGQAAVAAAALLAGVETP